MPGNRWASLCFAAVLVACGCEEEQRTAAPVIPPVPKPREVPKPPALPAVPKVPEGPKPAETPKVPEGRPATPPPELKPVPPAPDNSAEPKLEDPAKRRVSPGSPGAVQLYLEQGQPKPGDAEKK